MWHIYVHVFCWLGVGDAVITAKWIRQRDCFRMCSDIRQRRVLSKKECQLCHQPYTKRQQFFEDYEIHSDKQVYRFLAPRSIFQVRLPQALVMIH